ncbi:pollen-specific leucine-rich repeat extensin-like protein 3 [Lactuca sativa]|uniref:pollen-specific leucine-rich repeat extensin-like protein 3 n=1 Tax=Lactuca sativa TaxID=4236 RepID=UPI0022B06E8B|nr:pollen-specific leucine-rich repeat extensin-like protein 3 [Lactuca sativa]
MLEEIRLFVMERIYTQRVEGMEWDLDICPTIRKRIEKLKVKQRLWGVTPCGYQKYEVRFTDVAYGVDLIAKKDICVPINTTEAYLKCYKYSINPLNSSDMWPDVPYHKPLPPKRKRIPDGPSVKRKRDVVEREFSGPSRQTVTRRGSLIRCVPSSSRGSGAEPSLSRGNEGPPPAGEPPPPPPPAAQQPPPPPPAAEPPPPPPHAAQPPPPPPHAA